MLHSQKIEFFHYEKNKKISLEAKMKEDMEKFLRDVDT
jgi:hypothetical protein